MIRWINLPLFSVCFAALGAIWCAQSASAAPVQETVSYSYPDSISDAEALQRALSRVKMMALEKECGTQTSGASSRFRSENIDELSLFLFEMVGGSVVGTDVVGRETKTVFEGAGGEVFKECIVSALIDVRCDKGERDPTFSPDFPTRVHLNETAFREGETMVITVQPYQNMYINVFQYLPYVAEGADVYRIFPNDLQKSGFVHAGQKLTIPDGENEAIYELEVQLPKGKSRVSEEIMVVGTKKEIQTPAKENRGGPKTLLENPTFLF
jgi:hypothetical protein